MPKGNPGQPSPHRGKGPGLKWLREHVAYQGEDCLPWPYFRDPHYGRGRLGWNGKILWAHRVMCELANGPAPADKPQAAHSCGNGHLGCCNPRHLSWKDNSENQLDRRAHGTQEGAIGRKARLTDVQIKFIQQARGKVPQLTLAAMFGVKRGTIEYWHRKVS